MHVCAAGKVVAYTFHIQMYTTVSCKTGLIQLHLLLDGKKVAFKKNYGKLINNSMEILVQYYQKLFQNSLVLK